MSFEFDALKYSYASRRSLVYGRRGMVSTSQPLAAQAGLDIIKKAEMQLMQQLQQLFV